MDLIDIKKFDDIEDDMVILSFGFNMSHVFKVKRLIWELPNEDPKFSYFRLEFDNVNPIYPAAIEKLREWIKKEEFDHFTEAISEGLIVNNNGHIEKIMN
ncbi:hypothetical protein [Bacillus cereus group sp. MYBK14-1]|uniref:hypothetical protein n=1 Tax=Bacillus cereus group sp. MYBK14-1 TaxID=3450682 RepID=UPI003F7AEC09